MGETETELWLGLADQSDWLGLADQSDCSTGKPTDVTVPGVALSYIQ